MFCHRNHARMSARIQKRSVGQTLVSHPPLGSQVGSIFRQEFSRPPQEVEPWGRNPTGLISNQLARNVVTLWPYGSPEGGMPSRSGFGVSGHPQITPLAPSNPHAGKKIRAENVEMCAKKADSAPVVVFLKNMMNYVVVELWDQTKAQKSFGKDILW